MRSSLPDLAFPALACMLLSACSTAPAEERAPVGTSRQAVIGWEEEEDEDEDPPPPADDWGDEWGGGDWGFPGDPGGGGGGYVDPPVVGGTYEGDVCRSLCIASCSRIPGYDDWAVCIMQCFGRCPP